MKSILVNRQALTYAVSQVAEVAGNLYIGFCIFVILLIEPPIHWAARDSRIKMYPKKWTRRGSRDPMLWTQRSDCRPMKVDRVNYQSNQ